MPQEAWKREHHRKIQRVGVINQHQHVVSICQDYERQCYSCNRIAHEAAMTYCNDCGFPMCMADDDCKAICLCDTIGRPVRARRTH